MSDVILYRGTSEANPRSGRWAVERMALHDDLPIEDTLTFAFGDDVVDATKHQRRRPFRVAYRHLNDADDNHGGLMWRQSCAGTFGAGLTIGDGSEEAAIAWLLEGEANA